MLNEQGRSALNSVSPSRSGGSSKANGTARTRNMGAYLRKMAIDGYIIKVGLHPAEKAGRSRQPGCREYQPDLPPDQQHRNLYAEDVAELKERQAEIWSLLKRPSERIITTGGCLCRV